MAWQWDLLPVATGIFGVDGQYDFVRATFTDGSNVPRMPPMRVGGGTYWRNDNWFVRMGLLHAFGQSDLGQNDTPTAGYNLLSVPLAAGVLAWAGFTLPPAVGAVLMSASTMCNTAACVDAGRACTLS